MNEKVELLSRPSEFNLLTSEFRVPSQVEHFSFHRLRSKKTTSNFTQIWNATEPRTRAQILKPKAWKWKMETKRLIKTPLSIRSDQSDASSSSVCLYISAQFHRRKIIIIIKFGFFCFATSSSISSIQSRWFSEKPMNLVGENKVLVVHLTFYINGQLVNFQSHVLLLPFW